MGTGKKSLLLISIIVLLGACGKQQTEAARAESEESVLAQSSFFPGEVAAPIAAQSGARIAIQGDGGVIPGPGKNSGGDGGSISPTSSSSSSGGAGASSGATSGTVVGGSSTSSGGNVSGGMGSGTMTSGDVVINTTSAGSTTSGASAGSVTGSTSGNDGGVIPATAGNSTGDGGGIVGSTSGTMTAGSSSGASSGSTTGTVVGSSDGSSSGSSSGMSSGMTSGSSGSTSGNDNGGIVGSTSGASTGSTNGNDGGVIGATTGNATGDGGGIVGSSAGSTSGSSSGMTSGMTAGSSAGSTTGTVVGSSGSTAGASTGSSMGGTSGNTNGNDGGVIGSTTGNATGDGGIVGNTTGSSAGNTSGMTSGMSGGTSGGVTGVVGNTTGSATSGASTGVTSGTTAGMSTGTTGNDGGVVGNTTGATTGDGGNTVPTTGGSSGGMTGTIASTGGTSGGTGNMSAGSSSGGSTGTVASSGGSTGGSNGGSSSGGSTGDSCHGCNCPNPKTASMNVVISRVCSVRRSGTDYKFFEEAKNPILSVEASIYGTRMQASRSNQLAYAGYYYGTTPTSSSMKYAGAPSNATKVVLQAFSLSQVDLFQGRFTGKISYDLQKLQRDYPREWRNALVSISVCDDTDHDGFCGDETVKNQLSLNSAAFLADRVPKSLQIDVWNGRNLTRAGDPEYCEKQYSPIVFDLNGDGFRLVGPESGVQFDLNDSGTPVSTGWVAGADDAFLVRDVNGNGRVDSGAELFGSATRLKNGNRALNGFEAMKDLDENQDGVLDDRDYEWRYLRLWIDRNMNGRSEKGEIVTLRRAGLVSIDLAYVEMMEVDQYGNQTRQRSTFRRRIGKQTVPRQVIDVWFNTLVRGN